MKTDVTAPRWVRPLVWALTVVLALFVGYLGHSLHDQLAAPDDNSVEAGFARDMSAHHAQAVEMALIVYPKATQREVTTMAYDIATTQQYQIGVMQTWLDEWKLSPTTDRQAMAWMPNGVNELTADGLMPGMATKDELKQLREATGRDADILFLKLMIRHHTGGLHMIEAVLAKSHDKVVVGFARGMKINQTAEITTMNQILTGLGAPLK